jgi:hypothetical protein
MTSPGLILEDTEPARAFSLAVGWYACGLQESAGAYPWYGVHPLTRDAKAIFYSSLTSLQIPVFSKHFTELFLSNWGRAIIM